MQMMMMKIHSEQGSPVPLQSEQFRNYSVMTESIDCLESECATLREENLELKKKINMKTPENILVKKEKVCYSLLYWTAFIITFKAVFLFVSPYDTNSRSKWPAFQQFILVLM